MAKALAALLCVLLAAVLLPNPAAARKENKKAAKEATVVTLFNQAGLTSSAGTQPTTLSFPRRGRGSSSNCVAVPAGVTVLSSSIDWKAPKTGDARSCRKIKFYSSANCKGASVAYKRRGSGGTTNVQSTASGSVGSVKCT